MSRINELAVFDDSTGLWLSERELIAVASRNNKVICHPVQNVCRFKEIAIRVALEAQKNLVVWAIDSMGYRAFKAGSGGNARRVLPVTSTVPSTSMTAWTSIFRGSKPSVHGIYGTAFYVEQIGMTISLLSRKLEDEHIMSNACRFSWLAEGAGATLFTELDSMGFHCEFMGLDHEFTCLSFWRQISEGADLVDYQNGDRMGSDPEANAACLAKQIEERVKEHIREGESFCCVAFLNCVRYISQHGYSKPINNAICEFAKRMCLLRSQFNNVAILAVADHGMIQQKPTLKIPLIVDQEILTLSRHKPGGAGRILFFYPKEGCFLSMWALLEQRIGENGKLYSREEYIQKYYGTGVYGPERIGDIVAVALNERFPSASIHDAFEHGGLHEEEMLSFISIL